MSAYILYFVAKLIKRTNFILIMFVIFLKKLSIQSRIMPHLKFFFQNNEFVFFEIKIIEYKHQILVIKIRNINHDMQYLVYGFMLL